MAFDEGLAQRVREVLGARPHVTERRMFGGLAFLLEGRMFLAVSDVGLMLRLGAERYREALAREHVREMDFTGKPMKGYVYVDLPALQRDSDLAGWVAWSVDYVAGLPPKAPKRPKPGT